MDRVRFVIDPRSKRDARLNYLEDSNTQRKIGAGSGLRFKNLPLTGHCPLAEPTVTVLTPARHLRFGALWAWVSVYRVPPSSDGRGSTSGSNILSNINNYQLSDAAGAVTFGAVSGFFTGFVVMKMEQRLSFS